jgi:hypothetical protein
METFKNYKPDSRGSLSVWDIDETLFKTNAKVYVVKNGKVVRTLTNQEFNTYQLQPGEDYDFREFRSAEIFKNTSVPIQKAIDKAAAILRAYVNKPNSKMIILTARADFDDRDTFLSTFEKYGLNMNNVYVERAGNLPFMKAAEAKRVIIAKYLDTAEYKRVSLFDDDKRNLDLFLSLKSHYKGVEFEAYLATHGVMKRYR